MNKDKENGDPNTRVGEAQLEEKVSVQAQLGNSVSDILGPSWVTQLSFSLNRPDQGWDPGEHV